MKVINKGKYKKINNIYELPKDVWKDLEKFEDCNVYTTEIDIEFDLNELPIDILIDFFIKRLKKNSFEKAIEYKKEIEKRGYTIKIDINDIGKGKVIIFK